MADNASCGLFVPGDKAISPHKVDLVTCGMVHEKNGEVIATGAGAAALGSPVNCVTWLANTLGEFGIKLEAGEVILSGSLVPLHPIVPGDSMHLSVGGIGTAARKLEMDMAMGVANSLAAIEAGADRIDGS